MVTEQVKRVSYAIRVVGFTRTEFSCRAEVKRIRDKATGRSYSQFGPAVAVFKTREDNQRAQVLAERIVRKGMVVEVFTRGGRLDFVTVREPRLNERPRVVERDLDAEYEEAKSLLAGARS